MKVLTTREFRGSTKNYFELAEKERVTIKRGGKFVNLIVSNSPDSVFVDGEWVKGFFAIPEKYRCNPFDYISDGDLFYADKRNVLHIEKAIKAAKDGKIRELTPELQKELLGL